MGFSIEVICKLEQIPLKFDGKFQHGLESKAVNRQFKKRFVQGHVTLTVSILKTPYLQTQFHHFIYDL